MEYRVDAIPSTEVIAGKAVMRSAEVIAEEIGATYSSAATYGGKVIASHLMTCAPGFESDVNEPFECLFLVMETPTKSEKQSK